MEKITKTPLSDIPSLSELAKNYIQWGQDFKEILVKGGKSSEFNWPSKSLYEKMRTQLCLITKEHCSFCDCYPISDKSKETIEHYFPKAEYPLLSFDWSNLFYCCDKCQSEANKIKKFQETLKPDDSSYSFSDYFYFDLGSGKIKVLENLEKDNPEAYTKANAFLIRYGINTKTREAVRKTIYQDIRNYFIAKANEKETHERVRDDFSYRYVYDYYVELNGI